MYDRFEVFSSSLCVFMNIFKVWWIALIILLLHSFQDTRDIQISTGIKQASKRETERLTINQAVEVDTSIIHEKALLKGYLIHPHNGCFSRK